MHILVNRIRLNNFGLEWCKIKILEFHQVHDFWLKNFEHFLISHLHVTSHHRHTFWTGPQIVSLMSLNA